MATIYLICGKICSGKSYYARELCRHHRAVILSTDEVTYDLTQNEQGPSYDAFAARVNLYLRKKAAEIARAGANVILDWGFWSRADREAISAYFDGQGISYEWHYVDVSDALWQQFIHERNERIKSGNGGSDFYVDDGLLKKLLSLFEAPAEDEMDVIYSPMR